MQYMNYAVKRRIQKPFLCFNGNIASRVNHEFEILTGYSRDELLGKTVNEVNKMLKTESQSANGYSPSLKGFFIFTKKLEPVEVIVSVKVQESDNERIYYFNEKKNSRVFEILPYVIAAIKNNQVGVVVYSACEGIVLLANERFFEILNIPSCSIGDYIGKGLREISEEFDESHYQEIFFNAVKTGMPFYSSEFQAFDKSDVYWNVSLVPVVASGEMKYVVYTVADVTEDVVRRKIVEEQKQNLEAIIENMSDGLFMLDLDYNMEALNSVARCSPFYDDSMKFIDSLIKYDYFDFEGNKLALDNHPALRILNGENLNCFRYCVQKPLGTYYLSLSGSPVYHEDGNITKALICIRDITEQVKKERMLRRQKEEHLFIKAQYEILNNIFKNLDFGVMRCSYSNFKIIDFNYKAFYDLKQIVHHVPQCSNMKGMILSDILSEAGREMEKRLLDFKNSENMGSVQTVVEGTEKVYRIIAQPLYGINNEIIEIIFITIDITDYVKSKEEMKTSLKVQDEIFANASHELKTPLSVIYSANQMMNMYLNKGSLIKDSDKVSTYNNIIKQNCFRLTRLINNITDLTKCRSGYLDFIISNVNIVEVVKNITRTVSEHFESKGIKIEFYTDIEVKTIACDTDKIERIMLNLISNSIKFSENEGIIVVSIHDKGDAVEIKVSDNGIGIDSKHIDYIFERYYQADKSISRNVEGSGIGLPLVKEFVELHSGQITVESEVGKGSTFTVELPVKIAEDKVDYVHPSAVNKIDMIDIEFSDIYNLNN